MGTMVRGTRPTRQDTGKGHGTPRPSRARETPENTAHWANQVTRAEQNAHRSSRVLLPGFFKYRGIGRLVPRCRALWNVRLSLFICHGFLNSKTVIGQKSSRKSCVCSTFPVSWQRMVTNGITARRSTTNGGVASFRTIRFLVAGRTQSRSIGSKEM